MKVRYNRKLGAGLLVFGLALLVTGIVISATAEPSAGVAVCVAGVVGAGLGAFYLGSAPYFVFSETEVIIPMQRGPARRTSIEGARVELDGTRLVAVWPDGTRNRLPVYRSYARAEDWAALVAMVTERDAA